MVKDISKQVEVIGFLAPTEAFLCEIELQRHDLDDSVYLDLEDEEAFWNFNLIYFE